MTDSYVWFNGILFLNVRFLMNACILINLVLSERRKGVRYILNDVLLKNWPPNIGLFYYHSFLCLSYVPARSIILPLGNTDLLGMSCMRIHFNQDTFPFPGRDYPRGGGYNIAIAPLTKAAWRRLLCQPPATH